MAIRDKDGKGDGGSLASKLALGGGGLGLDEGGLDGGVGLDKRELGGEPVLDGGERSPNGGQRLAEGEIGVDEIGGDGSTEGEYHLCAILAFRLGNLVNRGKFVNCIVRHGKFQS